MSFITNTDWQSYGGETTMSYLSQMAGLAVQNFLSAATGIALAMALIRGFARAGAKGIGNFWADLVRATLYVLLPACFVLALFYVWQGVPQNLSAYVEATTLEGAKQTIAQGPVASQLAIKMLGTNGGASSTPTPRTPFENPTALVNLVQMLTIFVIGAALTNVFGRAGRRRAPGLGHPRRHGRAVHGRRVRGLLGRGRRQSPDRRAGRRQCGRQHGGQGGALRRLALRAVRRHHHGRLVRRGQRHA